MYGVVVAHRRGNRYLVDDCLLLTVFVATADTAETVYEETTVNVSFTSAVGARCLLITNELGPAHTRATGDH